MIFSVYKAVNLKVRADADSGFDQKITWSETSDIVMALDKNGNVKTTGLKGKERVHRFKHKDELRQLVLDKPGVIYDIVVIELKVPEGIPLPKSELLAIHGVGSKEIRVSKRSVFLTAYNVSDQASITVVSSWPEGTFSLGPLARFQDWLTMQPGLLWLTASVIVASIGILISLSLIVRRIAEIILLKKGSNKKPTYLLPPAVVGVIVNQRLTNREIAATLLDLARRGYLTIVEKGDRFMFVARKSDYGSLYPFERTLLSEILNRQGFDVGADVYKESVSSIFVGVYDLVSRMGVFQHNPRQVHLRWKLTGILTSIVGTAGTVVALKILPDPPFAALFWIGLIAAGIIIFDLGGGYIHYTEGGKDILREWLAFSEYLKSSSSISATDIAESRFLEYLPYALVLNCSDEWVKRYKDAPFIAPSWYITVSNQVGVEPFYNSLKPTIDKISRGIYQQLVPGVD